MSEQLTAIVGHVAPALKSAGFRKRRHAFNRAASDGITHVLSFQAGSFDPPGTVHIPDLRPNLYGKFTINLGVHVQGMRTSGGRPAKDWVNEYECHLRKRLGELSHRQDHWWDVLSPNAAADVASAIESAGLPWLDLHGDAEAVINRWRDVGSAAAGLPPAGPLEVACLLIHRGDLPAAEVVLRDYMSSEINEHHRSYLVGFLPTIGMGHLLG